MFELSRTVRFCLGADGDLTQPRHNTYAAWPPPRGLARYFELKVTCRGHADPATGYFINIKHIDAAVRDRALPRLSAAAKNEAHAGPTPLGKLLHDLLADLNTALDQTVAAVELQLTPFTSLTAPNPENNHTMQVLLKQRYEFSAAHRLHVPQLSDEKNREVFGKCNNPAGHGHNYTLETVVACPVDSRGRSLDIAQLDAAVDQHVIQPLDHKHLNHDVPAFADHNPSVEHISAVIWDMLAPHIPGHGHLLELSVWETGKTVCTFRGPDADANPAQQPAP